MPTPLKYNPAYHDDWAWSLAIKGATDQDIADAFHVSRRTIIRWRQTYPSFNTACQSGKEIADAKQYTREDTKAMKDLGVQWKQIGSCGKDHEDQIWKEFRSVMDAYFDGLKEWNEQKHAQWHQRMVEARTRKQELIQNQKRQIQRMKEEMVGLLGQRAIDDMQDRIEEKEDFIAQLEAEVEDIDKTLSQQ